MVYQHPYTDLEEILHRHPHLSRKGCGEVFTQATPAGPGGPETLKAEGNIFEKCLQNKKCSAGCKDSFGLLGP